MKDWGIDWKVNIRWASVNVITGHTPYTSVIQCLPPWIYLLLSPIAILPEDLGIAVIFVLTYMVVAFVLYRLNGNIWIIIAFLLNSYIWKNARVGNIDFLAMFGFILPPQIGLFFVLIKPQIGAGIAIFWLIEAWRKGKFREIFRIFAPVTIAYLLSFLLYGLWPLKVIGMTHDPYNSSLWPWAIPIGVILLYKSIRERNSLFAIGASPFVAPYVNFTSYVVALFPFFSNPLLLIIVAALSWL